MSSISWTRRVESDWRKNKGGSREPHSRHHFLSEGRRRRCTSHGGRAGASSLSEGEAPHLTELSAVLKARGAAPRTATGVSPFHPPSYYFVPPAAFTYLIDSDTLPPPDWEVAEPLTPRQSHEDELGFHPTSCSLQRQKTFFFYNIIIFFYFFFTKNIPVAFSLKDCNVASFKKKKKKKRRSSCCSAPLWRQRQQGYIHR